MIPTVINLQLNTRNKLSLIFAKSRKLAEPYDQMTRMAPIRLNQAHCTSAIKSCILNHLRDNVKIARNFIKSQSTSGNHKTLITYPTYLKSMCDTDHVNVLHVASVHAASSPEPSSTILLRLSRMHILDPLFVLQLHGCLSCALNARGQAVGHGQGATNCSESRD